MKLLLIRVDTSLSAYFQVLAVRMLMRPNVLLLLTFFAQVLRNRCRPADTDEVSVEAELFTLYPGKRLDLSCSPKDSPHTVNWTKDHVAVVDGEHTRIRNGQLEIEAVEPSDSGLYACTTFGNHSLYFNVTVGALASFEDDDNEEESSSEENKWLTRMPPQWAYPDKMEKKIYKVPATSTVKLRCQATGNPTPTLRWYKNGKEVKTDHRVGSFKLRDHIGAIIMESVVPSDNGNYTCVVENEYGSINYTYQLDVVERSFLRPILQTGLPANRSAVVGSDVEFVCKVFSNPHPHIQWLKHEVVNGTRFGPDGLPFVRVLKTAGLNTTDKEIEVLQLRNVSFDDAGEYTCLAGNSFGISHNSAWLTVLEAPHLAATPSPPSSITPPPLQRSTYLDVVRYWVGFILTAIIITVVIILKIRASSKKRELSGQLAVNNLTQSVPLRRRVTENT